MSLPADPRSYIDFGGRSKFACLEESHPHEGPCHWSNEEINPLTTVTITWTVSPQGNADLKDSGGHHNKEK